MTSLLTTEAVLRLHALDAVELERQARFYCEKREWATVECIVAAELPRRDPDSLLIRRMGDLLVRRGTPAYLVERWAAMTPLPWRHDLLYAAVGPLADADPSIVATLLRAGADPLQPTSAIEYEEGRAFRDCRALMRAVISGNLRAVELMLPQPLTSPPPVGVWTETEEPEDLVEIAIRGIEQQTAMDQDERVVACLERALDHASAAVRVAYAKAFDRRATGVEDPTLERDLQLIVAASGMDLAAVTKAVDGWSFETSTVGRVGGIVRDATLLHTVVRANDAIAVGKAIRNLLRQRPQWLETPARLTDQRSGGFAPQSVTPLAVAALHENVEAVRVLLEFGAIPQLPSVVDRWIKHADCRALLDAARAHQAIDATLRANAEVVP